MKNPRPICAVVLPATLARPAAAEPKPNVLLRCADDPRDPPVGCYGNKAIMTPNLDRFAAERLRFARAAGPRPQCMPSHASCFTGCSPVAIVLSRFSAPLPRAITKYPAALRTAGGFTGSAGRRYPREGAKVTVAEPPTVFDQHKLVTFPDRLDYVKTGNGRALSPSRRRHCPRPGTTSRPIPFTIL